MSYREVGNNRGLQPVKRQFPGLSSWTRAQNKFSSLSLSIDKNPPHCNMLVAQPTLCLIILCPETRKGGSSPTNWGTVPSVASSSAIQM